MNFMFSTVCRVTQKDFYARPYTSMWAPVVARQISKRYSSSCHVFISMWGVISSTASVIRCLKSARSRNFLLYRTSLINPHSKMSNGVKSGDLGGPGSRTSSSDPTAGKSLIQKRGNISVEVRRGYNRCPHWSVRMYIKILLSYSVHCWKHKFHKAFRY
jgi:hypothetical protein